MQQNRQSARPSRTLERLYDTATYAPPSITGNDIQIAKIDMIRLLVHHHRPHSSISLQDYLPRVRCCT